MFIVCVVWVVILQTGPQPPPPPARAADTSKPGFMTLLAIVGFAWYVLTKALYPFLVNDDEVYRHLEALAMIAGR
jgi:hypothetical protein